MPKKKETGGAATGGVGERRRSSTSTKKSGGKMPLLKGKNTFLNAAATKVAGESKRKLSVSGRSGRTSGINEGSKTSLSLVSTGDSYMASPRRDDSQYQVSNSSIPSPSTSRRPSDSLNPSFQISPMPVTRSPTKPTTANSSQGNKPPPILEDYSMSSAPSATQSRSSRHEQNLLPAFPNLIESNSNIRRSPSPPSPIPNRPKVHDNQRSSNNPTMADHSRKSQQSSVASSSAPSSTIRTNTSQHHGSLSSAPEHSEMEIPHTPDMDASYMSHRSNYSAAPPSPIPERPEMPDLSNRREMGDLSHSRQSQNSRSGMDLSRSRQSHSSSARPEMDLSRSRQSHSSAAPHGSVSNRNSVSHGRRSHSSSAAPQGSISDQNSMDLSRSRRSHSSSATPLMSPVPSRSQGDYNQSATSRISASSRANRMNDVSMMSGYGAEDMDIDEDDNDMSAAELSVSTGQGSIDQQRLSENTPKRDRASLVKRLSAKGLLSLPIEDGDSDSSSASPPEKPRSAPNRELIKRLSTKGLLAVPPQDLGASRKSISSHSTGGSHGVTHGVGQKWLAKPPTEIFNDEDDTLAGDEDTAVVDSDEEITLGAGGDSTDSSQSSSNPNASSSRGKKSVGPVDVDGYFDDPGDSDESSSDSSVEPPAEDAKRHSLLGNPENMDPEVRDAMRRSLLVQKSASARSITKSRLQLLKNSIRGSQGHMSDASSMMDLDELDDEFDMDGKGSVSTFGDDETEYFVLCGVELPRRCNQPSCNRLASVVVRYLPCFWCFPIPDSATDRTILTRLNILSAFFCLMQLLASGWLVTYQVISSFTEPSVNGRDDPILHGMTPNLWSLNDSLVGLCFTALGIFIANIFTIRIIQDVNLVGAIRYLWLMLWIIPFETFLVIALFDYHGVTNVWIKHWWPLPSMSWFRLRFCEPDTAYTLCVVPILESPADEIVWCYENYRATNCTAIRDAAQQETEDVLELFFNANVSWGFFLLIILFLIVNTLERIISRPMVQKSRESNVPGWLTLPILGCVIVGAVLGFSPTSVLSAGSGSYEWIGIAFIVCGGIFFVAAILGWLISIFSILSNRDKRYKLGAIFVFIILMGVCCAILTIIFIASISGSLELVTSTIDDDTRGSTACGADTAGSCSNCDGTEGDVICPEWSTEDTLRVLQTQTKGSASLAVIFWVYSISALRFGFLLRKHVSMYQIAYI